MNFENTVTIITGGSSGIGLATAKEILKKGGKVVIADINEPKENLGNNALFIKTDVSLENNVLEMINKTITTFGKLNYLVANAGIGGSATLPHEVSFEEWNKVIGVNETGIYLTNKYAIKEMLKIGGGAIVNTSSMYGLVGSAMSYAYSASKGAINQMTRSTALAYAKQNIRINAVAPGYVDTPILSGAPQEMKDFMASSLPIGRLGTDEEIAHAICFLLSDKAKFITGAVLSIDGGFTAQ